MESRPQIIAGRFFDSEKSAPGNLAETIERCGEHKIMRIRGGRMRLKIFFDVDIEDLVSEFGQMYARALISRRNNRNCEV